MSISPTNVERADMFPDPVIKAACSIPSGKRPNTGIQTTTRRDSMRPEVWTRLSWNKRDKNISGWAEERTKLQIARLNRGIYEVPTDDDYLKVTADAHPKLRLLLLSRKPASGQPVADNKRACGRAKRKNMDHISGKGYVGSFHCGLVLEAISIQ